MQIIGIHIRCYDRDFIIETNDSRYDFIKAIMRLSYETWVDYITTDECCEEYICSCLQSLGIDFKVCHRKPYICDGCEDNKSFINGQRECVYYNLSKRCKYEVE